MNINLNSGIANIANPRVRRQKFGVGSLIFLLLFGIVFTAAGLAIIKSTKIDSNWTRITGQVVSSSSSISNGSTIYTPVVKYQVNGQSYTVAASSGSSFYPTVGSPKQVAYNPSQPQEAKVVDGGGTKALLYLFPAIGILCIIFSLVSFIRSLHRSKDIHGLVQTGQKLQGILTDVQISSGNNNNNTYKIVVSATDNAGVVQTYVSDSLTGIGGLAMADFRTNPIPIDVYVNPANSNDYYVDVSDIPNLTPGRITELIKAAAQKQSSNFAENEQSNPIPQSPAPNATSPVAEHINDNNFPGSPQQPLG